MVVVVVVVMMMMTMMMMMMVMTLTECKSAVSLGRLATVMVVVVMMMMMMMMMMMTCPQGGQVNMTGPAVELQAGELPLTARERSQVFASNPVLLRLCGRQPIFTCTAPDPREHGVSYNNSKIASWMAC